MGEVNASLDRPIEQLKPRWEGRVKFLGPCMKTKPMYCSGRALQARRLSSLLALLAFRKQDSAAHHYRHHADPDRDVDRLLVLY